MRHPSLYWHRQKDLNPRLSVLETDALPTELYLHIIVDTRGLEPHSQDFQSCAYTMSAKCPLMRKQKDWLRLSLFSAVFADLQFDFRSLFEARPLSRGLVSTAHPCFLLFDTAKLDSPNAAYLRSRKKFSKIFSDDKKTIVLDASEIISKFASYTNLLKMEVVKLNRIKAVLAETDKQGKWLAQQLGKDPTTVSKWCTNTIQPDLKTLAEIAELLNVNIRELLVNTK